MKKRVLSWMLTLSLLLTLLPVGVWAEGSQKPWEENSDGWYALTQDNIGSHTTLTNGCYYLSQDVELTTTIIVNGGTEEAPVVLDLNGHVLKQTGNVGVIRIESTGCLLLQDSDPTVEHKFEPNEQGLWELNENGSKIVSGGVLTGGKRNVSYDGSGGGVCINGTFVMDGGNIVGCNSKDGGGVFIKTGTFVMDGGSIIGCTAWIGAAIYIGGNTKMFAEGGTVDVDYESAVDNCGFIQKKERGANETVFRGGVINDGKISAGTFYGAVSNRGLGTISDGIFYGEVTNGGNIANGIFHNTVKNYGTISDGTFHSDVENEYGTINGGTYYGTVTNNEGTINGGTFRPVTVSFPYTTTVAQGGGDTPPATSFTLELLDSSSTLYDLTADDIGFTVAGSTLSASGAGENHGTLTLTAKDRDEGLSLSDGIFVRQKQDGGEGWTLDDAVYYIKEDTGIIKVYTTTAGLDEDGDKTVYAQGAEAENGICFTNTYTKTTPAPTPSGSSGNTTTYYRLNATANEGGRITPAGDILVRRNGSKTYTITAEEGYVLRSVLVDGVDVGAVTSYTFEQVREDHTIKAVFAVDTTPAGLNSRDHTAYVLGYPDGTVHPNDYVTRGEAAAMLYRLLTEERRAELDTDTVPFSDVPADAWYWTEIAAMAKGGYFIGYEDGSFGGERGITRAELVTLLVRFAGVKDVKCSFSDVAEDYWAYAYIATATEAGWIEGYEDGTFRPAQLITRAEVITVLNRALCRGVDEESELLGAETFSDNPEGAWYYYEIIEASHGHDYIGTRPSEDWTKLWQE